MTRSAFPTKDVAGAAAILLVITFFVGPLASLLDTSMRPLPGAMPIGDYPAFWLVQTAIVEGRAADLYDQRRFSDLMTAAYGPTFHAATWFYPPHFLLALAPLGFLPYAASWFAFMASSFSGFAWAMWRAFEGRPLAIILGLLSPAAIINVMYGQTGYLASALLLGGLALRSERPVLAGVLIGLLTVKPQFGLLLPVILLFERRWLVIASAAISAAAVMAFSAFAFGPAAWMAFFGAVTGGDQAALLDHISQNRANQMASPYGLARSLGAGHGLGMALQGVCAAAALFGVWRVSRSALADPLKIAAYVALSYIASPYMMVYDHPALAAAALVVALGAAISFNWPIKALAWAVFAFPVIQLVSEVVFVPVGAAFTLSFALALAIKYANGAAIPGWRAQET